MTGPLDRPIITVTLNPALDVSTTVHTVTPDRKLRCSTPLREAGGGGVNVARVTHRFGADTTAVVVVGGPTGDRLASTIADEGLRLAAVTGEDETRECLAVTDRADGRQYRFVLPGPALSSATLALIDAAIGRLGDGRRPVVVVSGSVPGGVRPERFAETVARARRNLDGATVIVDTSGPVLGAALTTGVDVIKPSARELQSLVEHDLTTEDEIRAAAEQVVGSSAVGAVLASMGSGGAVLARRGRPSVRFRAPTVDVRSAVGAGDSMVGGMATGLAGGLDLVEAAALGVAAGTAAVTTTGSELCRVDDVDRLRPMVRVEC